MATENTSIVISDLQAKLSKKYSTSRRSTNLTFKTSMKIEIGR